MPVTGWIAASSVGWPAAFFLYGALGAIWVVIWFFFGASRPSTCKNISEEEKKYIEISLGHCDNQKVH